VNEALDSLYRRIVVSAVVVALVAALIALYVSRRLSRQMLCHSARALRPFAAGDLSHKLLVPKTEEFRPCGGEPEPHGRRAQREGRAA